MILGRGHGLAVDWWATGETRVHTTWNFHDHVVLNNVLTRVQNTWNNNDHVVSITVFDHVLIFQEFSFTKCSWVIRRFSTKTRSESTRKSFGVKYFVQILPNLTKTGHTSFRPNRLASDSRPDGQRFYQKTSPAKSEQSLGRRT